MINSKKAGDIKMKFIGDNLRKFRTEKNLTRDELAQKIKRNGKKITGRTVMNWENGITKPDADSLVKMHQLFNKDLILFFVPVTYETKGRGARPHPAGTLKFDPKSAPFWAF
mgnify:CR=1 FL=1